LLIIVFIILGLRVTVPEKNIIIEDITDTIPDSAYIPETTGAEPGKDETFIPSVKPEPVITGRSVFVSGKQKMPLINLNNCDTAQLISLPGIGRVLSVRIIRYRNLLGGYASVSQLKEVYGLPPETFELIKERVFADESEVKKIKVNSAGYRELSVLPYFEEYELQAIFKYRKLMGRIEGIKDLTENKLISNEKAEKVRPYLIFDQE